MNTLFRAPTSINTASYITELQQLIREKSENFCDREFAFAAITDFLHRCKPSYFTNYLEREIA
jgi:hypothetical protein